MRASIPLLAFLMPLWGGPVLAQGPDGVLAPLVSRSSLVRLRQQGTEVTGRLIALTQGVATFSTASGNRAATLASGDSIWVRGHATRTGMIIGGITGGVLGGVYVSLLAQAVCESDCDNVGVEGAFVGAGLGLLAGGLLGAGIGAVIPKWHLRFP